MKYIWITFAMGMLACSVGCENSSNSTPDISPNGTPEPEQHPDNFSAEPEQNPDNAPAESATYDYTLTLYDTKGLVNQFAAEPNAPTPPLIDTQWTLLAYGYTDELKHISPLNGAHLTVSGDPYSRISGYDGCNSFSSGLEATQTGWATHLIISTLRLCYGNSILGDRKVNPQLQELHDLYTEQEAFFYDVVRNVTSIEVDNGVLLLMNAETKTLTFTAKEQP